MYFRKSILIIGLLHAAAFPLCAQKRTMQDSLKLQRLLKGEGEVKLNPEALKKLEMNNSLSAPKAVTEKSWMNFDNSLPVMPKAPEKKVVLTLRPYTANTKYNWDPVYRKKIKVDKDTWRGKATGLRYRVTERVNNMAVGGWQGAGGVGISGLDLMMPFTREFWNFKGRKRRARTLEILKTYGDSTTVLIKQPVKLISR